ncbi:DUF4931 domain-containing protein [Lactobacillus taiwanensis]|uniref:DUF4931 domain-containing protein n=1 Tax=Lactobacillus taiwanensis TaxID=508451 RepID=UPI000B994551|nr:DUF4931 domain-containing protein [Lactobacillus taiwanensis]OYS18562.1 DUF4931 domain-containing protein [Lactobacillus taiwanensis]OYS22078.1 DUF4931 domain-containing protein [Lactobacillus taiwanensis]OYS23476.1 DUF4931 domain-containing protein [Lactobacillus taiwanensis]OYS25018.1 DUF4931 domain-containing protein [Lactobacillus taiwanensis]OYS27232.1 DUF4931 domain-containing protein [Lactobacillus taiwanensis]
MNNDPLIFEFAVAKNKPSSFNSEKSNICPFCDVENLTDIYQTNGSMIWLANRFPTLKDTKQTVIIESNQHKGDVSSYSQEYNRKLMKFALNCFDEMQQSGEFRSVLWYKNFGPKSNGSLAHPHMQVVGLNKEDGYKYIYENNFTGIHVFKTNNMEVNFATHPIQGFQELNINLLEDSGLDKWADWIQYGIRYTLKEMYGGRCDSYNLFFYPNRNGICCKIIPRFYAPPYFVGYKLSECNDNVTLRKEAKRLLNFVQKS